MNVKVYYKYYIKVVFKIMRMKLEVYTFVKFFEKYFHIIWFRQT
jgi:hypothetical protein